MASALTSVYKLPLDFKDSDKIRGCLRLLLAHEVAFRYFLAIGNTESLNRTLLSVCGVLMSAIIIPVQFKLDLELFGRVCPQVTLPSSTQDAVVKPFSPQTKPLPISSEPIEFGGLHGILCNSFRVSASTSGAFRSWDLL